MTPMTTKKLGYYRTRDGTLARVEGIEQDGFTAYCIDGWIETKNKNTKKWSVCSWDEDGRHNVNAIGVRDLVEYLSPEEHPEEYL